MICLKIQTSKSGRLWPTEYYKTLVDALSEGGSSNNPQEKYPDLRSAITNKIVERMRRYFLAIDSPLADYDDVALRVISIKRVKQGDELIQISHVNLPNTSGWDIVPVKYFGTIGNSKYEAQSNKNRELIAAALTAPPHDLYRKIYFSFQLSNKRKDRDLDNLVDAIIPMISKTINPLDQIVAVKEDSSPKSNEVFRFSGTSIDFDNKCTN